VDLSLKNDLVDFLHKNYYRTHNWKFQGGSLVEAFAAPEYFRIKEFINPGETFAGSLASYHMLNFLALTSMKKQAIAVYEGNTIGSI
jgi:hypothetical protein